MPSHQSVPDAWHDVLKIVLIYAAFAAAWILFSDELVHLVVADPERLMRISILKGWAFVAVTSLLLYFLLRRAWQRQVDALRERMNTLRLIEAIADGSEDAVFAKDLSGRYLLFNRAASRFVGKPATEVVGRDDRAIFPPEQADMIQLLDRRVVEEDCVRSMEERLDTADGVRVFLATKGPLRDEEGRVFGIFGISRDITTQKRAEAALRENMELLRLFVDHAPAAIAMFDREMRYLHASRRWRDDYALGAREIVGHGHYDIFPDLSPELRAVHQRALRGEVVRADEDRFLRADGSVQWLRWEVRPWQDAGGSIGGIVIMSEDVTERKSLTAELERHRHHLEELVEQRTAERAAAESRLRMVIESSADGIIELDAAGNIAMVNPAASEMLGYLPEELLGRNAHAAIHAKHADGESYPVGDCAVIDAVLTGRTLRLNSDVFWRADGSPLPVSVATHPILRGETILGAVMSFSDATERQRAEAERERARAEAERLARIKGEFLANMSHEIRTPLNGMLGLAQIGYRDSVGRDKAQETFGRILDSGRLLLTVINDILDFSKIEAGKLVIEAVPLSPAQLVDEALGALTVGAAAKDLVLVGEKTPDLPAACLGDPVRISQILLNLLSNAVKFTRAGEVRLSAWREGAELVFCVADSGIGISPADLERLFRPFEQADSSTTRKYGGTGLGLAISRRLADLMGGRLVVTSTLGVGSRFELRLPLVATDRPVMPPKAGQAGAGQRLAGLRILVAEDNEVNRFVLEDFLRGEGAWVEMTENGCLAIEAATRPDAGFHVVLMDVQMPEMDGIEATRRLRQLAPELPVIGQTAHALKEEHDRCLAAGMAATLVKPIDIEQLVAVVLTHAGKPVPGTAPASVPPVATARHDDAVDWTALQRRFRGRREFIDRLVTLSLKSNEGMAQRLRVLVETGELTEIGKLAHTLKGFAGSMSAPEVERLAIRTLAATRAEDGMALTHALDLADALERLMQALAAARNDAQ
jgi:PAS domain S-box-containing protein